MIEQVCEYCSNGSTDPEAPEGFCGLCTRCGKPGHVQAHPSAPYSAVWCEDCYASLGQEISLSHVFNGGVFMFVFGLMVYLLLRG